ncbi:MAG: hypothetical protein H0T42_03125 [Deltaproteobacteria bacterium]|nr:hypothetical protein [Deltaproteobacteria bacterium]
MNKLLLVVAFATSACAGGPKRDIRGEIGVKLASAQTPIQACFQNSLYTNRKLRGMYVMQMAVNADTGEFGEINLRRDEPQDPVLRFCVISVLAKLKLDKPPGKRVELESVPIKFDWSNP